VCLLVFVSSFWSGSAAAAGWGRWCVRVYCACFCLFVWLVGWLVGCVCVCVCVCGSGGGEAGGMCMCMCVCVFDKNIAGSQFRIRSPTSHPHNLARHTPHTTDQSKSTQKSHITPLSYTHTTTYPRHTQWADGMPRLKRCFAVLDRLLLLRAPRLHAHFAATGVHVAHFSSRCVCCFGVFWLVGGLVDFHVLCFFLAGV
jgi:hypothetical protein